MSERLVWYLFTCGPFLLVLLAWAKICLSRQTQRSHALGLVALSFVTMNATLAAGTFLYYEIKPLTQFTPPWKDPEILQFGLLFLLAPIGMVLGIAAGVRGAPKWLVAVVELASLPLLVAGLMATMLD